MKKLFFVLFALSTTAFAAPSANLKLINVAELEAMTQTQKGSIHIFDANKEKTRLEFGIIPGAKLLDSVSQYSASMLPPNKQALLVFYCANTQCTASHQAAEVAKKAGYNNVMVFADGIQGWKNSGKPTEKYSKK